MRIFFDSEIVSIPTPHFVVFYNGLANKPAVEVQRLSKSYVHNGEPELELICTVYNINEGKNSEFLDKCPVMKGYMCFVDKVREYEKAGSETPIEDAISWCDEHDVLREFLLNRKDEVIKAMTIDMTNEAREEIIRKEERAEGRAEGRVEGREEGREEGGR